MAQNFLRYLFFCFQFFLISAAIASDADFKDAKIKNFKNITLEVSLKPFKKNDKAYIEKVCTEIFNSWKTLLDYSDGVSIMLWTSDGSEILDYTGNPNQNLEWAKYIGNPNTEYPVDSEPKTLTLHQRAYHYMENPPSFTYADLKFIVSTLKKIGIDITGKDIRVGATFDPGPEFAKSEFKYKKHPEICLGNTMGKKSFVCCYATLDADKSSYAGYPEGFEKGLSFGKFFGRQAQHFLSDLGFDYLWFSNGLGFGLETWRTTGAIMDKEGVYKRENINRTKSLIMDFWKDFRSECPNFRIETRGTNISTSADIASDGTDLRGLYKANLNFLPPPNSPWAALNGDFGLELAGYMSRIAELPENDYMYRYYTHDPWWANSPWLDRYARQAHDIYMPLSVARFDENANAHIPTYLNFLSIDDSYGNMPMQVPSEVSTHILQARRNAPDSPSPIVWAYPFDEYHDIAFSDTSRLEEIFFADWYIAQAINNGVPINSVVSVKNLCKIFKDGNKTFDSSIIVTTAPIANSEFEKELVSFLERGGKLVIYGTLKHASKEFCNLIGIKLAEGLEGEFEVTDYEAIDKFSGEKSFRLTHKSAFSGGGLDSVALNKPKQKVLARAKNSTGEFRDIAVLTYYSKGVITYLRGTNYPKLGGSIFVAENQDKKFPPAELLRAALSEMGFKIIFSKPNINDKTPINCISKSDNAFCFAGFTPDQTVEESFKFPFGAPIFTGYETNLLNGAASYRMPKSYFAECRVFVEQNEGKITLKEHAVGEFKKIRHLELTGLNNAKIRVYPSANPNPNIEPEFRKGSLYTKATWLPSKKIIDSTGTYWELENVSGNIFIIW